MKWTCGLTVLLLFVGAAAGAVQQSLAAEDAFIRQTLQPLFEQYCYECHDDAAKKAGLSLQSLATTPSQRDDSAVWTRIFDRLQKHEMPPAKSDQLAPAELKAALDWIGSQIIAGQQQRFAAEGRAAWRRLSRIEYQNTIRDLLLVDVDVQGMLPDDGLASGFDNVDAALDISPVHLEKYLEAADAALDVAIVKTPRPKTTTQRHSFLDDRTVGTSKQIVKLPDAAVFTNETYPPKILRAFQAPVAGRYRFRISTYAYQSERSLPLMIYAGSQDTRRGKTELTQVYDALPGEPQVFEWIERLDKRDTVRVVTKGPNKQWGDAAEAYTGPGLAVQWIEIEGPLVGDWPPPSHLRLLGEVDLATGTSADAERIVRQFATRAFRRPASDEELQPIFALMSAKFSGGGKFEDALRIGLKTVLVSPDFLFLRPAAGPLDGNALASRLSYFLWSTQPDETLLELASRDELTQPAVLHAQVERLLGDPKAVAFTENFTGQWLKLRDIRATSPDKKLYPEFDALLEWSMIEETHRFFNELLTNDLSVLNFIDSDFALLNSRLCEHYGLYAEASAQEPLVATLAFRKTKLPPASHRGGVLTQASVLKVTANGTNTSPVMRGVFFLDRILGTPVPPPPKNVPAIEPDTRGATTIRAQLQLHRNVELCATCHVKIDPPGATLENYDVIGGWRENYRALGMEFNKRVMGPDGHRFQYGIGPKCETDGILPGGQPLANLDDLKRVLLADEKSRDQVARSLAEKLLVYATGHELEFADREAVSQIVAQARQHNYGLRQLIHAVVQSPTFLRK